jgi:hypothetical protein
MRQYSFNPSGVIVCAESDQSTGTIFGPGWESRSCDIAPPRH